MFKKEGARGIWRYIVAVSALLLAIGIFANTVSAGIPMNAPADKGGASAAQPQPAGKEKPFDCSRMKEMGIDKQMNFHANEIMAACSGLKFQLPKDAAPSSADLSAAAKGGANGKTLIPSNYGGPDVCASCPDGTYPKVTQSESMVWGHGNTVVVNYNDGRTSPTCYGGYSFSTDGGTTWTRPGGTGASPICTGHGTNYGDPIVVWNAHLNAWFLGDLTTGCGGQGIGMWTSTDGQTFTPSACAHSGTSDDRESMWVDNAPSSPFYGRMYVSWNNFAAGQNIYVVYSDNGTTWSTPVQVQTGGFIRNVQDTGSPNGDGTVFIAGMNESGGGLSNRTNIMYRSTNGGAAWTAITMGSPFPGPGDALCDNPYFAKISPIWRHMGWGQPAVGPQISGQNVVHYVYAAHGSGADTGDIMYTRSVDNGSTWSTPIRLNTDTGTRAQWMPSLAVTNGGSVMASWYDRRNTSNNDYEWYGNMSRDNGATWQGDMAVSDQIIPQPLQPDSGIQACYAGDYNYHSADGQNLYMTWTDGRVLISGNPQQDVFFDKVVGGPTLTPTPPPSCDPNCTPTRTSTRTPTLTTVPTICGMYTPGPVVNATIAAGTDDTGNHGDDVVTSINLPFPVRFYNDQQYTSANVSSNGNLQFTTQSTAFPNECLPSVAIPGPAIFPFWDDLRTDTTGSCSPGPCGIYTSVTGNAGSRTFNIEWRTFYFSGAGSTNFEIQFHEGTPDFDLIYGNITGALDSTTVGVQDGGVRFTQIACNTSVSQYLNKRIPMSLIGCGPTNTPSRTPTPCVTCPTNTRTTTATGTPCGGQPGWADKAPITASPGLVRADAASMGNMIYVIGGRSADTPSTFNQTIYVYNPATDAWATASTMLTDTKTSNLAVVMLNGPNGPRIYAIGGSTPSGSPDLVPTNIVRVYDPVSGSLTNADSWPQTNPYVIPGGWTVYNNRLYMFGGYDPAATPTAMISDIWEFNPMSPRGSQWTHKNAHLSIARAYIAVSAIGNFIYLAGGSQATGSPLTNETIVEKYNPANDAISAVAPLPVASSNFKGFTNGTLMYAPGGVFPTAVNMMQIYDPTSNTWTSGAPMLHPVRNYAAVTMGNSFYAIGGYEGAVISAYNQRFNAPGQCATPTNTPSSGTVTRTPTRTFTPGQGTATRTPQRTITPCAACNMDVLAVVTSCYLDGTVHWIAIVHNPDRCGVNAPWRAELQVRNNGGNFRTVRIQYATSYFGSGDTVMDGYFCYHFSSNVRDLRVEYLFEDQQNRSQGSNTTIQERSAPPNSYSATPESGIPVAKSRGGTNNPSTCNADMASQAMAPCEQGNDGCSPPPSPIPTGAPVLPAK